MKPAKHIKKFYDLIHKMTMHGHIDTPDKYVAVQDIEIAVHKLRQAFEFTGEIKK
uniref:Uncharacterized protein n=1 Tax=viral metagenome TaxID=1070528 RepID=A0A6M3JAP2_9ZZZZ